MTNGKKDKSQTGASGRWASVLVEAVCGETGSIHFHRGPRCTIAASPSLIICILDLKHATRVDITNADVRMQIHQNTEAWAAMQVVRETKEACVQSR